MQSLLLHIPYPSCLYSLRKGSIVVLEIRGELRKEELRKDKMKRGE